MESLEAQSWPTFIGCRPARLAQLLSITIFKEGRSFQLHAGKNDLAAALSLRFNSMKSVIFPCLSIARYKYIHLPLTLM